MPTQIPPAERQAFLDIIKVKYPVEAATMDTFLFNYEDIIKAIRFHIVPFSSYTNYLEQAMSVFTDADLLTVGIYLKKTEVSLVTNPVVLISTITQAKVLIDTNADDLIILGNSLIDEIDIDTLIHLKNLWISSYSIVTILDLSLPDCIVNLINLKTFRNIGGQLLLIIRNTVAQTVGQINIDEGSYFGGYGEINPSLVCAEPITNITTENLANDSITIKWTLPTTYLFVNIYTRISNDGNYLLITPNSGVYIDDDGFIFTNLQPNTSYDFKINTTCINGGTSSDELITLSTTI